MKKKIILIVMSVVMLSTVSYAQRVIMEGEAVIIDCSGMDSKFYVSEKKARTTNATDSTAGSTDLSVITSAKSNERVYKKFEVAAKDNYTQRWEEAIKSCADNNTNWRLPTQRELMLMYVLRDALEEKGLQWLSDVYNTYCSATEASATHIWAVDSIYGDIRKLPKRKWGPFNVRCVRDI